MLRRNELRAAIHKGAADALHCTAWADCEEKCGRARGGVQLDKICGEPTQEAVDEAANIISYFGRGPGLGLGTDARELELGLDALAELYEVNVKLEGHERQPDPHSFGWYLAMQALGTGVAWSDDHPDHGLKLPSSWFDYGHPSDYGAALPMSHAREVLLSDHPPCCLVLAVTVNDRHLKVYARSSGGEHADLVAILGDENVIDYCHGHNTPRDAFCRELTNALKNPIALADALLRRLAKDHTPGAHELCIDYCAPSYDPDRFGHDVNAPEVEDA